MKNLKKLFLLFVLTTAIFSCEKNETDNLVKQDLDEVDIQDVYVKNGVLVFKDWDVAYKTLENLENKDVEFLDEWEQSLGFTSLRSIYDCFTIEEEEMVKELENLYNENNSLITEELVAEKYNKLLESYENSIILVELEDDIKYYDMNIYHDIYAPIVNENGIVSVGGEIYRYTNSDIRTITNGDWSKLSELLNDKSPFVEYRGVNNDNTKSIPDPGEDCDKNVYSSKTPNHWEHSKSRDNGVLKTILYAKFLQHRYSYYDLNCNLKTYTKTNFYFKIRSLQRTMLTIPYAPWINYDAPNEMSYEYTGTNIENNSGGLYYEAHTYTKTLLSCTTTSNHPAVNYFKLRTRAIHWPLDPSSVWMTTTLIVNH